MSNLPTSSTGAATFCQLTVRFPIHVMNVSSTTGLARELKPLDAPFLPTDDPRILWLRYQILKYSDDWLKTIEVRPGVYEKSEKKM